MSALSIRQPNQPGGLDTSKLIAAVVRRHAFLVLLASLFFSGCTVHQISLDSGHGSFRTLPEKYRKKAFDYEKKGLYLDAIQSWRIVRYFSPEESEIREKINSLTKKSQRFAGDHFNKGVNFFQNGRLSDARREFLLTLAYDQDHASALDYLKNRLQQPVSQTYKVQPGDTAKKVATKVYRDPNKDVLILAFNDVPSSGQLPAGSLLQIPLLHANFLRKEESGQGVSQYDAVSPVLRVKKTKESVTVSPGKDLQVKDQVLDEEKSDEATEEALQQAVDAHYRKGISYFLSEDLDQAIVEWEEVLRLMPTHLKAKKDLQNAKKMQQRVNKK